MGAAAALVNIITGLFQVIAWRRMVAHIRVSLTLVDSSALKKMTRYCSLLAIWIVGMICVSGLDVTIVGHFAYEETAYYSIATLPINFMILIMAAILGPMMPASSALSTQRSNIEMGSLLARVTRYSTVLLLLTGLPLVVCGYPILRLWVGPTYALHSLTYLRILVLANIIRNLCAPYATMIAATGKLGGATIAPIVEAVVNLAASIYFASRFGAIGVAFGTLLGSFVSVVLHYAVSMHFSRTTLAISRRQLFLTSFLRPAIVAIPSILLIPLSRSSSQLTPPEPVITIWVISTILFAWFGSLNREDRDKLLRFTGGRLMRRRQEFL
jgi:O-antigen/teichoic acid export membrane protein